MLEPGMFYGTSVQVGKGVYSVPVTPNNMVSVEIRPGWMTATLARYIGGNYPNQVALGYGDDSTQAFLCGRPFAEAVQRLDSELASRNAKYESAWLTDYILTSLADLKDKLYRLSAATRKGAWVEWDDQKRRGTYYDILARTIMLMALEDANSANLEGVLDDD